MSGEGEILVAIDAASRDSVNKLDSKKRKAMFLAQCHYESGGFLHLEENGDYNAKRLREIWPKRFNDLTSRSYAHHPERILSRAYAGRLGNGNEMSRDGWIYRGRGLIQLTGKENYTRCATYLHRPYVSKPELIVLPIHAVATAIWFWVTNNCAPLADEGDVAGVTKIINGGMLGLPDRKSLYASYLLEA